MKSIKKITLLFVVCWISLDFANAQNKLPIFQTNNSSSIFTEQNISGLDDGPYQISEPFKTSLNIKSIGRLERKSDIWIYSLIVQSDGATAISVSLDNFNLVDNDRITIYSDSARKIQTISLNDVVGVKYHINTKRVKGDKLLIQFETNDTSQSIPFIIKRVNHFFVDIPLLEASTISGFGNSGSCQVDVKCVEGDIWHKEINSVVRLIVDELFFCTAAVINNTKEDGRPFILSANHCFDDPILSEGPISAASNTEFLFNYESPWCSGPDGSLDNDLIGSVVRARSVAQDMILLELNQQIPTEYYTYYSGWDRLNIQPPTGVGIHHPAGDVKKIATHTITPSTSTCMGFNRGSPLTLLPNSSFWQINWIATPPNGHSVTEGGSSGSPLYNANHRIIGQLWGAGFCTNTNCSNPTTDIANYGKVFSSWLGSGSTNTSLSSWLDPVGLSPNDYLGLRYIRFYTVDHNAWFTGDVVKFHDVDILPGHDVVVTELQDRFEATGTLDIPAGVTFRVDKP